MNFERLMGGKAAERMLGKEGWVPTAAEVEREVALFKAEPKSTQPGAADTNDVGSDDEAEESWQAPVSRCLQARV